MKKLFYTISITYIFISFGSLLFAVNHISNGSYISGGMYTVFVFTNLWVSKYFFGLAEKE